MAPDDILIPNLLSSLPSVDLNFTQSCSFILLPSRACTGHFTVLTRQQDQMACQLLVAVCSSNCEQMVWLPCLMLQVWMRPCMTIFHRITLI